jgi:ketosteroid isomerase-like protein
MATVASGSALAQSPRAPAAGPDTSAHSSAATSAQANEAVKVVNDFMTALASGQLEVARQLMAPDAVVMVNGQVLGDRDGYINGPAKGDYVALRSVQRELLHRDAKADAQLGWVLSEKRMRAAPGAQGPAELVLTETMLLARTPAGWKIAHIHWSGRPAG